MSDTRHIALVTGAGLRLGRAIALKLAGEGCDVVVHYNTSADAARETAQEIAGMGRIAHAIGFDQGDGAAIAHGIDEIAKAFGRAPDVLVNCASIFEWDTIDSVSEEALKRHYAVNLIGPVLLTRHIAERASEATRGLILNLLDNKLGNPNPDHLSYTLSKFALAGFTEMMARGLSPRFRVNAIAPGHTLPGPGETAEHFAAVHDQTPLGRGPTADDIADAAAYLLKAEAVTGQVITVDGGARLETRDRDVAFR